MSLLRLAVVGASGRMGRAVVRLAREEGAEVVCAIAASEVGRDAGEVASGERLGVIVDENIAALERARPEVVIDFSAPALVPALAVECARRGAALVSGTTGLQPEGQAALDQASLRVPVLWEPNMSLGVHVLGRLVAEAIRSLGRGFDVEIVETHHRKKLDAPSGTALRLAEIASRAAGGAPVKDGSRAGPRGEEIAVHALRGGDVIGDHTVNLFGMGERLELTHRATTRDLFARGALRAAAWIRGKPPARYGLSEVLG